MWLKYLQYNKLTSHRLEIYFGLSGSSCSLKFFIKVFLEQCNILLFETCSLDINQIKSKHTKDNSDHIFNWSVLADVPKNMFQRKVLKMYYIFL